jgi:dTDP-4-amino-4,6-dideoxygalactose transaminase
MAMVAQRRQIVRQIPPTATPLGLAAWSQGLRAGSDAVGRFAAALRAYLQSPSCFLASSGRTALYLLLKSLREQPAHEGRSEVVLPAYTCPALVKVILDAGLSPRLVDLDPATQGVVKGWEAALSRSTLAVIWVHPFGVPQPVEAALHAAHAVGAVLIEDAAQALGARLDGRLVGTLGDAGLFSLGPGKPLSTGGGGIVCTNDTALTQSLDRAWQTLETPGGIAASWALLRVGLFSLAFHPTSWWLAAKAGAQKVGDSEASWGYALSQLTATQAAVGLRLLPTLDAINSRRRERAARWQAGLAGAPGLLLPGEVDGAIYLRLPVVVQEPGLADVLQRRLAAAGIGAGRMYRRTLAEIFPALAGEAYPGSEQLAAGLLTLPTNHYVTAEDIACGVAIIREAMPGG